MAYPRSNSAERASVTQLGYVGFGVSDMAAWRDFAGNLLGLQEVGEAEDGSVFLRHDNYHRRIELRPTGEDDIIFSGWEVKDVETLAQMADQIRAYGIDVTEGTPEECARRMVIGLIKFKDPDGLDVEIYCGGFVDHKPFISPRGVRGFNGGNMGLGHILVQVANQTEYVKFYTEVLGARLSDYIQFNPQVRAVFMHVNPRHHSLAVVPRRPAVEGEPAPKRLNHFMIEVLDIDDVGLGLGLFQQRGIPTGAIGRHTNDKMTSFYGNTPSGFNVEFGYGGLQILNEETWEVQHHRAASIWGHGMVQARPAPAAPAAAPAPAKQPA